MDDVALLLSQYQYGVPASVYVSSAPGPASRADPEQDLDYKMQRAFPCAREIDTVSSYFHRFYRIRYLLCFLYPPLYLALILFVAGIRDYRHGWVVLTSPIFALGTNVYPFFLSSSVCRGAGMPVYTCERGRITNAVDPRGSRRRAVIYLCVAQFVFAYGTYTQRDPDRRIEINRQLAKTPGKPLYSSGIGLSTFFRTSGFTTQPISTMPVSFGREIWATPKTRSCCITIRIARYCCWNPTRARRCWRRIVPSLQSQLSLPNQLKRVLKIPPQRLSSNRFLRRSRSKLFSRGVE